MACNTKGCSEREQLTGPFADAFKWLKTASAERDKLYAMHQEDGTEGALDQAREYDKAILQTSQDIQNASDEMRARGIDPCTGLPCGTNINAGPSPTIFPSIFRNESLADGTSNNSIMLIAVGILAIAFLR